MSDLTQAAITRLLDTLHHHCGPPDNSLAAELSKVAAKAQDDVLLQLSEQSHKFVDWLTSENDDPLVKAYTACILANIAFLAPGQDKVLAADGVRPLVQLLKGKDSDKKITLHSTAAVQNLTYKNTTCCQQVLECGGEGALKKLLKVPRAPQHHCFTPCVAHQAVFVAQHGGTSLPNLVLVRSDRPQHKSDDVQQFAAGALANLQLYRGSPGGEEGGDSPSSRSAGGSKMSRRVAKILRRGGKPSGGGGSSGDGAGGSGSPSQQSLQKLQAVQEYQELREMEHAAITIQAHWQGMIGRKKFQDNKNSQRAKPKGRQKYGGDNILQSARQDAEKGIRSGGGLGLDPQGLMAPMRTVPLGGGLSAKPVMRRPMKLEPLPAAGGAAAHLPPMPNSLPHMPMPPMPSQPSHMPMPLGVPRNSNLAVLPRQLR